MRPHPRYAATDPSSPRGWGTCERCGFVWNHHKLAFQNDWRGTRIENTKILVCPVCMDEPQRQLGVNIIEPDPVSLQNARPEQYYNDEGPGTLRITEDGHVRAVEGGY